MPSTRSGRTSQAAATASIQAPKASSLQGSRSARIHALELRYQALVHETDVCAHVENKRRLQVESLLARNDANTSKEQLAEKKTQLDIVVAQCGDMASQLQASEEQCQRQEAQLKVQAREIAMLQTELKPMRASTADSTKLLTEKLALSRKLDTLEPELDHLRKQLDNQKQVIAEKLALEHQVSALETELEAEKHSKQRALSNSSSKTELADLRAQVDELEAKLAAEKKEKEKLKTAQKKTPANAAASAELQAKIKDLEKKLALEVKDKERIRKDSEKELTEASATAESYQERLEGMKIKMRDLREELRNAKAQIESMSNGRAAGSRDIAEKVPTKGPAARKGASKKRRADEMEDLAIVTPGAADGKTKKPVQTQVGEKSNFSVTPFLNRTKGDDDTDMMADMETPVPVVSKPAPAAKASKAAPAKEPATKATKQKPKSRLSEVTLTEDLPDPDSEAETAPEKQTKARGRQKKTDVGPKANVEATKGTKRPAMASLDDGDDDEDGPEDSILGARAAKPAALSATAAASTSSATASKPTKVLKAKTANSSAAATDQQTKKKRKVLSGAAPKTLFEADDDEDDDGRAMPFARSGAGASVPGTKRVARMGGAGRTAVGGVKKDAFGKKFSPLKKDKRGVGASFLA